MQKRKSPDTVMSWRSVVISKRCKLDVKMGYMVIRTEETQRIFLDEIALLMIENPAVSLTACLLQALNEKKVRVIFCDSTRTPVTNLVPLYGSHDTTRKLRKQISWSEDIKGIVWSKIIKDKISKQSQHLADRDKTQEALLLESYISQVDFNDKTNREGHAAKVYFNALFGKSFTRRDENAVNSALNYGYSILLSAFNREINAYGYITELGIHHDNVFNHFNLSSDLMEPFRILIDRKVYECQPTEFSKVLRYSLIDILNDTVIIEDSEQKVLNAIHIYVGRMMDALMNNDTSNISVYHYVENRL